MKTIVKTEFGDPILRKVARQLTVKEVTSEEIQTLIRHMQHMLLDKKFGVGLAAPQVGQGIALFVMELQPTEYRPDAEPLSRAMINPKIIETDNETIPIWEGCLSSGKEPIFAKVPRHKKVTVEFLDQEAKPQRQSFEGLAAQVVQHELDHLSGILFVDRVEDPKTYMTFGEYKKHVLSKSTK